MRRILLSIALLVFSVSPSVAQHKWTSLFDSTTLKGWKKVAGDANYEVINGAIVGTTVPNTPNTFLITEKTYSDFVLELEVNIEDTTSNSGIQFRSQYDPTGNKGKGRVFGYQYELDPSSRMWTGGVYDEGRRDWLYPLMLNAPAQSVLPVNKFNKVKIECVGNVIRTWINDKPAAQVIDDADSAGVIALQVHSIGQESRAGKKIHWKNIRIRSASSLTPFPSGIFIVNTITNYLSPVEKSAGWSLLFDGKTSAGWKGAYQPGFPNKGWEIAGGELRVLPAGGGESNNGGDIVTVNQHKAFDLSFDFKLTPGANSGLKYFVTLKENNPGSAIGLEYQLLDDTLHPDAKLGRAGNRTLASLYDLIKAEKQTRFIRQPGKWNTARVIVYPDNRVQHFLNGIKVLEYVRGSEQYRALVAESKYKIWPGFGEAKEGHILLQDHGNAVSFRSIRICQLK